MFSFLIATTFDVAKGDRIGLIGSNGSGKTTLFKLICGEHSCTQGNIVKASDTTVGFVEQHACQGSDRNVYNEILTVFSFLEEMEKQLDHQGFLRIQKSYLVNMAHLQRFQCKEAMLDNGMILPVSEKSYAEQKKKYLYWRGMQ